MIWYIFLIVRFISFSLPSLLLLWMTCVCNGHSKAILFLLYLIHLFPHSLATWLQLLSFLCLICQVIRKTDVNTIYLLSHLLDQCVYSPDQQVLQVFAIKPPFPSICSEMLHPPALGQDTQVYTVRSSADNILKRILFFF